MKTFKSIYPTVVLIFLVLVNVDKAMSQTDSLIYFFKDSVGLKFPKRILTGSITDSENSKPIPRVGLYVNNKFSGVTTDDSGQYFLELAPGDYRIAFRHISMIPEFVRVSLYANGVLNITMEEKNINLEEVVIEGEGIEQRLNKINTGVIRMNAQDFKSLPAFLGEPDIIKGIQTMPGVSSVGEGTAGFNVRGGQTDQNLILMGESIVINSNHGMGFLSSFNPDVVEAAELYKGNTPSQYGGRVSSALKMEMKKGDFQKWVIRCTPGTATSKILA